MRQQSHWYVFHIAKKNNGSETQTTGSWIIIVAFLEGKMRVVK
jgi:hypothetical protein